MSELFNRVNWVDLFALILLLRICYVSSYIGVGKQILPLFLLAVMLPITMYNYREIAAFFINRYSITPSYCFFLSFAITLMVLSAGYRILIRISGVLFPGMQGEASGIEKVGGVLLGIVRSLVIIGMLMIGLLLMPVNFIEDSVKGSYSAQFFVETDVRIYTSMVNLLLSKKQISYQDTLATLLSKKSKYIFKSIDIRKESRFFSKSGY